MAGFKSTKKPVILKIPTVIFATLTVTDILFLTEMQKRQTPEKGFALFKNDITNSLRFQNLSFIDNRQGHR
jgi:hypothetical protein